MVATWHSSVNHLTIALCPVVASTAAVFRHIDVLRVIQLGKRRVHYCVDNSRLEVEQNGTWNIMLIICLSLESTQQ